MTGLYFLAAFFIAAFGAVLIGFALNGKRRRRRLAWLLKPKKTALAELKSDDVHGVRLYGFATPDASGALTTAFTGEAAVYEKLFLEQWLHTWVPTLAERRGEHFLLTETPDGGARVRVPIDGADLMLKTLTTKYATLMFDEEDVAEYTEKVPEPFRARVIEHVKAAPGWYRVRIERIAVGTPLFVLGNAQRGSGDDDAFEMRATTDTSLLITDHDEQELFRPPPVIVLALAALVGVVMLAVGMVLLVWAG
jgi:hypothetical protein